MSKKSNTLLFVLGATVFNILTTIIFLILLLLIYARLLVPMLPESVAPWGFLVCFVGGIALSFVLYRIILKQIMKKYDLEKYFDPIFGPRKKKLN
ncbi:MAG: leader peptide processing enzyme [Treponema sp.]|nr:leader peptide processing enzyme [Treponema sp.]